MLNELVEFLGQIGGSSSREGSDGMRFLGCLFVTVCSGIGCLLYLIFAGHGAYSGDATSLVTNDLKIAATLALVTMAFGYLTARWFREGSRKEGNE